MQVLVKTTTTVEEYTNHSVHKQIMPPANCANCCKPSTLRAHGYYERYTTDSKGKDIPLKVKRFYCESCRKTTSCLPHFVQPYRKINNATIEAAILNKTDRVDVQMNEALLRRYMKAMDPPNMASICNYLGLDPPEKEKTASWRKAVKKCGSFADLTTTLVGKLHTTCFGAYECHQRC